MRGGVACLGEMMREDGNVASERGSPAAALPVPRNLTTKNHAGREGLLN